MMQVKNDASLDEAKQCEQIRAIRRDSMQRVNALLTPEQQAKLAQMRRDRRADKWEHKQYGAPQNNGGLDGCYRVLDAGEKRCGTKAHAKFLTVANFFERNRTQNLFSGA